jgi:hypothetical protein
MCLMMCRSESVTYLLFGFVWVFARPQDNSMYAYIYIYIYIYMTKQASERAAASKRGRRRKTQATATTTQRAGQQAAASRRGQTAQAANKQATTTTTAKKRAASKQASKQHNTILYGNAQRLSLSTYFSVSLWSPRARSVIQASIRKCIIRRWALNVRQGVLVESIESIGLLDSIDLRNNNNSYWF